MNTLGMRHVALNVKDPQASKEFYMRVLKMQLEWEPDPENVYLTSGGEDNLAIHKAPSHKTASPKTPFDEEASSGQRLDHIGFALPTMADVDAWYEWVKSHDVKILREIKTHRDGARSFYMADPDGVVIQMIYHPPIAQKCAGAGELSIH
jgi:catechol 2,3-dioxygenase-like lactoylglutathione lyase family enzyme